MSKFVTIYHCICMSCGINFSNEDAQCFECGEMSEIECLSDDEVEVENKEEDYTNVTY